MQGNIFLNRNSCACKRPLRGKVGVFQANTCQRLGMGLDDIMKHELLKNKIYALILITIGVISILIEYDGTFFVLSLMLGIPLFFARENQIT